ncbi:FtsQ-type POTRA domain-containing protein [Thermus sp. NEB1569]|uniref:FtsQ-type POTRA domain-containing protein n=1 Tax=Thermus sp. NEB1569 TaxID=2918899 RepID=UPI001EFB5BD9|nr:FtsQ-type POTRA domain-containing protein [Thermus sp. NEB1569]ULR39926.1 FtsQ-type POTRA domain-containing protein [Thermus sp. NEB1569]
MWGMRLLLALLLAATIYVASLVLFPVEHIVVMGNQHLKTEEILARTQLYAGEPWLWIRSDRLQGLRRDPWVAEARLEKPRVGEVRLILREREPFLPLADGNALATDGTVLPGGAPMAKGPRVEGEGPLPVQDLLALARAYPEATRLRYTPAGFWVETPQGVAFAPEAQLLIKYAQAGVPKGRVYLYSWGVSVSP